MLARLILLLLVFASLPAMATGRGCHEQATTAAPQMAAMPGMPAHRDGVPAAEHRCLGCMPLPDAAAAPAGLAPARVRVQRPLPVRLDLRAAGPPALPPPRIG